MFHTPRDIYKKASTGKNSTVPGIGVTYEESDNPEVTLNSEKTNPEECAKES